MKEIQLTRGKVALVDDNDYEWLSQWRWFAVPHKNTFYAVRTLHTARVNGKRSTKTIFMHRVIMNTPDGMLTDHRDHNGLNNRRYNLRVCTDTQNQANGQIRSNNKSGYKGVYYDKRRRRWVAQLVKDDQRVFRKSFRTPEEAARAYDAAALQYFGPFANLNFPNNSKEAVT